MAHTRQKRLEYKTLEKREKSLYLKRRKKKKNETYHPPYSPPMAGFRNISPDETRKSGRTSAQTAFLGMHLTM
jgi:hypothetical protein